MSERIARRTAIKWVAAAGASVVGAAGREQAGAAVQGVPAKVDDPWRRTHDRVWLGGGFWANPMENWRVFDGAAECLSLRGQRSIHSLTHQISDSEGSFAMSVEVSRLAVEGEDGGAGFRIGIRSEIEEYRSNCFARSGIDAGLVGGQLVLGSKVVALPKDADTEVVALFLTGNADATEMELKLEARSPESDSSLAEISHKVPAGQVLGNVALVDGYSPEAKEGVGSRYRFRDWTMEGDAFIVNPQRRFGPLLWSMYSLSDSRGDEGFVMKISALTGPMGADDSKVVELQIERDDEWQSLGEARLDPDAWVATFRIANWKEKADTPYKLVYREKHRDGTETPDEWSGTIRANPANRSLRMAALTCQNDYAFPYQPVASNVEKLDADLVFFSGDQIYESHGGFGIIREPAEAAILCYLRKFYQFGWSFREIMRNQPTLCLPDDHDVFQGNIWGEGGATMVVRELDPSASFTGGYREPARMVNAVHRTNVAHHPDAYDPSPSAQDISVYYGDMVYGGVGFAIIADRQWKSGPERFSSGGNAGPEAGSGRPFDLPGLVLLGERQEQFLKQWAEDWRGHTLKALLSQTVFAGVATHHGSYENYMKLDFDSAAWPQTPRDRAIEIIRPSMALHINGDQHLTSLCQYGVDRQRDSNWSFCTPAVAVGFPRWWRPDDVDMPHENRPGHGLENTGEYIDGFGNKVYVHAVGNPEVGKAPHRYDLAHEKGSGFGFITFDTVAKTYLVESFRFLIDVTDGKPSNQFPGWPVTIQQAENRGDNGHDR